MVENRGGRRALSAARTRAAILDAARELFVSVGYDGTSTDDIGAAAQASKGTVYHHFHDKQEIFTEVFTGVQSAIMRTAAGGLAENGTAWEGVRRVTRGFLRSYVADTSARSLLRQAPGVLGWDRVRELDEATALPLIRAALARSMDEGALRRLPVDATAEIVFGMYCNAVLIVAASDDPDRAVEDVEVTMLALLGGLAEP